MGNLGAFALIGVLVILTLLCHTGYSLRCYNCFATDNQCNMTLKCRVSLNACLHAKSGSRGVASASRRVEPGGGAEPR
ncbi:PREDICTED: CD59 glycoprotein-like [Elephantulus edwardii]|uniref:CD59 glycoprotein-like n=1 Tax=Elephantulus edwardii TaxID=28737 RepID=UPI0003F08CE3|nr:PREDICTED: CD59 glycoprotein-like [Elephantulus edwardii]